MVLATGITVAAPDTGQQPARLAAQHPSSLNLGNQFYQLWLDRNLVHTCACFPEPSATLEEAQIAKMDHGTPARSRSLDGTAADVVAAGAETHAALRAGHFVILAQAAAATGADGHRGTMAIHYALSDQAPGHYLFAPAFSLNKWSHGVLLSAVIRVEVAPRRFRAKA